MASDELYTRLEPQRRRYEEVADRIQQFIVENHYKEGDLLPTERRLTELLGVSRTVVRESFKILSQKGLLDIRPGKGALVTKPSASVIGEMLTLHLSFIKGDSINRLVEVRRTLEVEIAGLAAARRRASDLETLEQTVETMVANKENQAVCNEADLNFHLALAEATQNELYRILLEPVRGLLLKAMTQVYNVDHATEEAISHHREILDCVRAGDEELSRRAMRSHLDQFARVLKRSLLPAHQRPASDPIIKPSIPAGF
jgi:GntR family transcriptional regulator, transcriptional repressor for pyruvate dehydrogenase complex